jgi:hypothetical protein
MSKTPAYYKGYEAKAEEIKTMGRKAALDKFNMDYPAPYTGQGVSAGALEYAHGEYQALCDCK